MTRKLSRTHFLSVVAPFFTILIFLIAAAVLAQTTGAGRPSGKANAVLAPPGAVAPPQALGHRLLPGSTDGQRALAIRSQKNKPGAGPMDGNPLLFLPAVGYSPGGDSPESVEVADLNGDGKPDLVMGNGCSSNCSLGGTVGILLGNGDGTFQSAVTYASGGWYPTVAVADVNGDGKLDLVVSNECVDRVCSAEGAVGVLLGNGDGTFQPFMPQWAGGGGGSTAVADLNGDGKPDLAISWSNSNLVAVLFGNGDGTFQGPVFYNCDAGGALVVADLNGDGKPDLVVASWLPGVGGVVEVLLGNGDGTFQPVVGYGSGGSFPSSVAVADVNRDGKPDLVVANDYNIGVLLGNGDGTFQPAVTYLTEYGSTAVAVADVDGDGIPDVLLATAPGGGDGIVDVLLGNGDGTFQTFIPQWVGGAVSMAVADLNGDGKPDLALAILYYDVVGVMLNNSGAPPTTTALVSNVNPVDINSVVTFTATVTSPSGGALKGTVMFQEGGPSKPFATVTLVGNQAACSTTFPFAGNAEIIATYSGDLNKAASSSATLWEVIVKPKATNTQVITSGSPTFVGQPVTFTATVTSKYGTIPDGELVTFNDGTTTLASVALAGGTASYTTSALSAKTHTIKANYAGDVNLKPSHGSVTQVVNKYPTTTALSSSLNPSNHGQAVTFTATVTSAGPTPTGKVMFMDGTAKLGLAKLSGGVAKLTTSKLAVGTHPITAQYLGDAASAKSTSSVLDQVVQ